MKKKVVYLAVASVLSSSVLFSSCIGSFSLSNKLLSWNKTIDSKFVNEILFVIFSPAYAVTLTADLLVLNSVEFWTGENPLEIGIIKNVQGENGIYTVETLEDGYSIKNEAGEEMQLIYSKEDNTWSMVNNNERVKLIKYTDDKHVVAYLPDGTEREVELSAVGVLAFRQDVSNSYYMALR